MPKIINDVKERLLRKAKEELFENGYKGLQLKKLAKDCSIAVGTIYNYFSSKDELIAVIIMEDWHKSLRDMDECINNAKSLIDGVIKIEETIKRFVDIYKEIWNQYNESTVIVPNGLKSRQFQLRGQISSYIDRLLFKFNCSAGKRFSKYFTEIILMCVMQDNTDIEDLVLIAERLFGVNDEG